MKVSIRNFENHGGIAMRNHEVTVSQFLLDKNGEIAEPGWARSQVWRYSRDMIKANKLRVKEWDYYLIASKDFALALTVSDDGYIGLQSVSLLTFGGTPWEHTETVLNLFPMGKQKMPASSRQGDVVFDNGRLSIRYELSPGQRHIKCSFKQFNGDKDLKCDVILHEDPNDDSMVIATPWNEKHAFYYNQKINCMPAEGTVEYDGHTYRFDPEHDFGTLDWGRGVWTYDNTWYWGSGNARIDGHRFGFNLGYGFGNTSAATENVIFWDGKAHKLDDVKFCIPNDNGPDPLNGTGEQVKPGMSGDMDSPEYMKEWTFTSSDGRFEAVFRPVLDRSAKIDLKAIISDQHQVFGLMSGTAVLDDGTPVEFKDVLCFAEKVHNQY